jgi:hypothetical protein
MIKSPVYDELAQAAVFSLSSISRIFMANCSSAKGFCRKRLRKSCFWQPSSRDVRTKESEFGWVWCPVGSCRAIGSSGFFPSQVAKNFHPAPLAGSLFR